MENPAGTVVTDRSALMRLASQKSRSPLFLKLDELEAQETLRWETRLNALRSDCGCSMGTVFIIAGFALYLLFLWLAEVPVMTHPWATLLTGLGVLAGSAALGKAVGILRARKKFAEAVSQLIDLTERKSSERMANHALLKVEG